MCDKKLGFEDVSLEVVDRLAGEWAAMPDAELLQYFGAERISHLREKFPVANAAIQRFCAYRDAHGRSTVVAMAFRAGLLAALALVDAERTKRQLREIETQSYEGESP